MPENVFEILLPRPVIPSHLGLPLAAGLQLKTYAAPPEKSVEGISWRQGPAGGIATDRAQSAGQLRAGIA